MAKATGSKPEPAEGKREGYTVLVSPAGFESTVPDVIKDALLESGYTEK